MRLNKTKAIPVSLQDLSERFLIIKETQGARERTMKDYKKEIRKFVESSSNNLEFEALCDDVLTYMCNIPNTSAAVYNRPYGCLNAFFNWMIDSDYIPKNPFKKLGLTKRKDDSDIHASSVKDVKALMKGCDKDGFTGFRNYVIIQLMIDTGIRTCEIVRLKDADVLEDGILISKDTSKTHTVRILYPSKDTLKLIRDIIGMKPKDFSPYIFPSRDGNQLDTNELSREFRKLCERVGVKITPYQLRHTYATLCWENGMDLFSLQKLMGHTDLKTTKRYTDVDNDKLSENNKKYSPLNQIKITRL